MESESCKQEVVIEIPPDIVKQEAEAVTAQYRRMARIPGFRPGHAPTSIVRRHFKEDIRNEVVQTLLPKYFENVVKDKKLSVIGRPHFDDLKFEPKKRTGNKPENKAGHVAENKGAAKRRTGNEPELRLPALTALPAAGISPATCAAPPAARFHNPSLLG